MKTTIAKRFDELSPGDVFGYGDEQLVVFFTRDNGPVAYRDVHCVVTGPEAIVRQLTRPAADLIMVRVERVGELTPAQQHADELLELARHASDTLTFSPIRERARALLDKIDPPQPPTLDEALALVRGFIGGHSIEAERKALELLDRARRSGVLS